jgi:hypothetical protein
VEAIEKTLQPLSPRVLIVDGNAIPLMVPFRVVSAAVMAGLV